MEISEFNNCLTKIKYDRNSFLKIYDYYFPRIVLHIRRKYPRASAEDIAHDFFVNLYNIKILRYVHNPTSWIYAACDNLVKKYFSKVDMIDINQCQIIDNRTILDQIEITENMKKIFDVLEDSTSKRIFYLYYWEGYNLREISEILELKKSTIKQKHARGIKKLKIFLYPKL